MPHFATISILPLQLDIALLDEIIRAAREQVLLVHHIGFNNGSCGFPFHFPIESRSMIN